MSDRPRAGMQEGCQCSHSARSAGVEAAPCEDFGGLGAIDSLTESVKQSLALPQVSNEQVHAVKMQCCTNNFASCMDDNTCCASAGSDSANIYSWLHQFSFALQVLGGAVGRAPDGGAETNL